MSRTCHHRDRARLEASFRRAAQRPMACPICALPWSTRLLIDLALSQDASVVVVARSFGVSRGRLRRHADGCCRGAVR